MSSARLRRERGTGLAVAALIIGILGTVGTTGYVMAEVSATAKSARERAQQAEAALKEAERVRESHAGATATSTAEPSSPSNWPPPDPVGDAKRAEDEAKEAVAREKREKAYLAAVKAAYAADPMMAPPMAPDDDFVLSSGEFYCEMMVEHKQPKAKVLADATRSGDAAVRHMATPLVNQAAALLCPS